jgi:hypothetical protein
VGKSQSGFRRSLSVVLNERNRRRFSRLGFWGRRFLHVSYESVRDRSSCTDVHFGLFVWSVALILWEYRSYPKCYVAVESRREVEKSYMYWNRLPP